MKKFDTVWGSIERREDPTDIADYISEVQDYLKVAAQQALETVHKFEIVRRGLQEVGKALTWNT
jgi:hypothetical protein